jgi:hypothetical protein
MTSKNILRLSVSDSSSPACRRQSSVSRTRNLAFSLDPSARRRPPGTADALVHHRETVIGECRVVHQRGSKSRRCPAGTMTAFVPHQTRVRCPRRRGDWPVTGARPKPRTLVVIVRAAGCGSPAATDYASGVTVAAPRGLLAVDWLPELGTSLGVARYARYQPWPFGLTPLWSGFSCAPTSPRLVFIVRSLIML